MRVHLRRKLFLTRVLQKEYFNKYRLSTSKFRSKNLVILNNRNIKIVKSNKLLNYKNIKSNKIIRVIDNLIYKLKLLDSLKKVFLVFYL